VILSNKTGLARYLAESGASVRNFPDIAGCFSGGLAVCGDAACIWDDLERLGFRSDEGKGRVYREGWSVMVVNKIGECFPGFIHHWYSNAGQLIVTWKAARRQEYELEFGGPAHTHSCQPGAMWKWPWPGGGTSAHGAMLTGLALGYRPVVLCGIPLDDGPHNGEPNWRRTKFASSEAPDDDPYWKRARACFKGVVFSMSGRTRDWFGEP
jgi:hypothetical protein